MSTQEHTPALTPMLSQYMEIKRQHPDAILFYRMGDFYEMFFEDAVTAAPILEVQLTSRDKSSPDPIAMCGIPHHSATIYLQKLLAKGFKVAICEQMEDPATAKGIVRREVVRVVTPSLIGDPELVPEESANILLALCAQSENEIEICSLDLLAGQIRAGEVQTPRQLTDILLELRPKELLLSESLKERRWLNDVLKLFPGMLITFRSHYFENGNEKEPRPVGAVKAYLRETQKQQTLDCLSQVLPLNPRKQLKLDPTTLNSLEILEGQSSAFNAACTLVGVMDSTLTPMGRRLLRDWLIHPSSDLDAIEERHEGVEALLKDQGRADALRYQLSQIRDLERLTTKTALGLSMPRDLVAIRYILERVPELKALLAGFKSRLLGNLGERLNALPELTYDLKSALFEEPPATLRDGGIFRDNYHPEIGEYRRISQDAKGTIANIETRERMRTGIPSLKIKYSKVFGYTIEVTKSYLSKVPREYQRKQTISTGERFITEELKNFEEKVISADHRLKVLEETLFLELRKKVASQATVLLENSRYLATLDVLLSFAKVALERGYVRPQMHEGWDLRIDNGRHPVIETLMEAGQFVPNSLEFSEENCRTFIITGPNMSGKSTIMRQVALLCILAQSGSFVPASSARLPLLDAVFTRIGSSDDLTRGRSTFMVEMTEVARILERATRRSLILIDEIGRGTSTYDGLSLAWALLEHFHLETQAKLLFATHFHELTALEKSVPGIRNANVLVENWKDEIVFLHKLELGTCLRSYGIEVASLAGLPSKVLLRAKELLGLHESHARRADRVRNRALEIHDKQLGFFEESKRTETQAGSEI